MKSLKKMNNKVVDNKVMQNAFGGLAPNVAKSWVTHAAWYGGMGHLDANYENHGLGYSLDDGSTK
jgi:hypothetical protein